jgi:hypothetical protein
MAAMISSFVMLALVIFFSNKKATRSGWLCDFLNSGLHQWAAEHSRHRLWLAFEMSGKFRFNSMTAAKTQKLIASCQLLAAAVAPSPSFHNLSPTALPSRTSSGEPW